MVWRLTQERIMSHKSKIVKNTDEQLTKAVGKIKQGSKVNAESKSVPSAKKTDVKVPPTSASAKPQKAKKPSHTTSKQARLIEMLRHPGGASITQIMTATGWQPHTVRGAISGALKKKLGLKIVSEKKDGSERTYRIEAV
jgi:hypothetical protein